MTNCVAAEQTYKHSLLGLPPPLACQWLCAEDERLPLVKTKAFALKQAGKSLTDRQKALRRAWNG